MLLHPIFEAADKEGDSTSDDVLVTGFDAGVLHGSELACDVTGALIVAREGHPPS